jgi:hypothetical protein
MVQPKPIGHSQDQLAHQRLRIKACVHGLGAYMIGGILPPPRRRALRCIDKTCPQWRRGVIMRVRHVLIITSLPGFSAAGRRFPSDLRHVPFPSLVVNQQGDRRQDRDDHNCQS